MGSACVKSQVAFAAGDGCAAAEPGAGAGAPEAAPPAAAAASSPPSSACQTPAAAAAGTGAAASQQQPPQSPRSAGKQPSPPSPRPAPAAAGGAARAPAGGKHGGRKICFDVPPEAPGWQIPASPTAPQPAAQQPVSKKRVDCKVKEAYKIGKTLGTGGFAIVKLATDRRSNEQYAVKIMTLPPVGVEPGDNESTREDIFKEIDILCALNHENVVYLKEYFEEGNKVYLITELVTGGELLEAVLQRGTYSESEARLAFVQLLRGIQYLHSRSVVHRDLKLENLLLASPDEITKVKIADFGLAKQSADAMSTVCGTPQYVAPEVIQGTSTAEYGPEVDMWSAGVVLFILLGGYPPFWSESEPALFELIRRARYSFDDPVWDVVSESAKDLIRRLLVVYPALRPSAADCLRHPWVTAGAVSNDPLTAARSKMQALSMKAPGFVAAMAAAEALADVVAVGCGPAAAAAGAGFRTPVDGDVVGADGDGLAAAAAGPPEQQQQQQRVSELL